MAMDDKTMSSHDSLARLAAVIESRKPANGGDPATSYVSRLLQEEGIAYSFEHPPEEDAEILVLVDDTTTYPPLALIDGGEQVGWRRRDVGEPACDEAVLFIGARPQGLGQAGQGLAFALAVSTAAIAGGQGAQAVQVVTGADGHALGHQFAKQPVEQGRQGRGACHRPASSELRAP